MVSKVNDYMPTPLTLSCFCEKCRNNAGGAEHQYKLYGVIMHLGATIASGHYVAYVKASENSYDYYHCDRDKEKPHSNKVNEKGGLLRFFKTKPDFAKHNACSNMCRSIDCCSVKINKSVMDMYWSNCDSGGYSGSGLVNNDTRRLNGRGCEDRMWKNNPSPVIMDTSVPEHVWFECDDETVRLLSRKEFEDILAPKPAKSSALTPYLLFYAKCP